MSSSEEKKESFTYQAADTQPRFPSIEESVLKTWKEKDTFQESMRRSKEAKLPEFMFYDGPPFATGLPHYGHILAGTIKDIVTRYAHQTGHHVERRFGWDCHGLPVEHAIDKKLGIKTKEDVLEMGVDRYNAECRSIVMRYSSQWREIITRCGRWIDFDNDYKTLDTSFMESVWWVFSELYKKNMVYQGSKVMPYSTACTTPLSNFEVAQNYQTVRDPSVIVNFPLLKDESTCLLAWTTTPWTLPSNVALCVNENFVYVKVLDTKTGKKYIMAKSRLDFLYRTSKKKKPAQDSGKGGKKKKKKNKKKKKKSNNKTEEKQKESEEKKKEEESKKEAKEAKEAEKKKDEPPYKVLEEIKGKDLIGLEYVQLFDFFKDQRELNGAFRVVADDYVTDSGGTGIVHQAPAFGEDDYRVCMKYEIVKRGGYLVCPVDDNGMYTSEVGDLKGLHVKSKGPDSADSIICRKLKAKGRLVLKEVYEHEYPHCWRSDTPLIYKAVPSWFINVPKIKSKLIANNKKTYWVPKEIGEGRFHNWLADARDWAVSRNRYWGTPIPVWTSEDGKEVVVVGSIAELEKLSGKKGIKDLHKDIVDEILIPDPRGKEYPPLKRTPEVFDCWFESGSMPYGQLHYPFEKKETFEAKFPADFIAEGLDQTRGWFYTLMVISTALFDKPAFKNVIVNGLVLAEDGKKMSKRLKNYPDPSLIMNKYGADALRLYLINSPVVKAKEFAFREDGVKGVVKDVILPWYHAMKFFIENARRYESNSGSKLLYENDIATKTTNKMDQWILLRLGVLITFVGQEMKGYRLYTVIPELVRFIDNLTNTYVRFNRDRMKAVDGDMTEAKNALQTLHYVLLKLCRLMAPFTPFLVEYMYQKLKPGLDEKTREDSVHFLMIPKANEDIKGGDAADFGINAMVSIVDLGRSVRTGKSTVNLKQPVRKAIIVNSNPKFLEACKELEGYIKSQLNCKELVLTSDLKTYAKYSVDPIRKKLGRLKGGCPVVVKALNKGLDMEKILKFKEDGKTEIEGYEIGLEDVKLRLEANPDYMTKEIIGSSDGDSVVIIDLKMDEELLLEGRARDIIKEVQQLRKESGLNPEDVVDVFYNITKDEGELKLADVLEKKETMITGKVNTKLQEIESMPKGAAKIASTTVKIGESSLSLTLVKKTKK
mmetsp:Transcript_189/g.296  ORF Transcript_189/g.296 Transcript_189/m.296 type:complete len:1161 (+) Transcript_189:56-3538(+)